VIQAAFIMFAVLAQSQPVPAGTRVNAKLETAVRTDQSVVGDSVTAVLNESLEIRDKVIVPEGSRLHGRVETIQRGRVGSVGWLRLVFREIHMPDGRRVPTWITNSFHAPPQRRIVRYLTFIGIGAAGGALIGGDKSRTTGVLGGILGGFLLSANTGHGVRNLTLKVGQDIWLQLGQDLAFADGANP